MRTNLTISSIVTVKLKSFAPMINAEIYKKNYKEYYTNNTRKKRVCFSKAKNTSK